MYCIKLNVLLGFLSGSSSGIHQQAAQGTHQAAASFVLLEYVSI